MALRATATLHRREMNHTEQKYAQHLAQRLMVGEIRWWEFEAWKFRLADNTYYTPDFIVVLNDLKIEAHEIKAYWKSAGKVGWTDDARVKIKCAAEQHPVRFLAVALMPDQSWQVEEFGKAQEEPPPDTQGELVERLVKRAHDLAVGMMDRTQRVPDFADFRAAFAEEILHPRKEAHGT